MRGAGVVLMGRAIADMAVDDDQRRDLIGGATSLDRLRDPLDVIGVADSCHVPAIGQEACCDVIAESEIRVPFNGDTVAVVISTSSRASSDPRATRPHS